MKEFSLTNIENSWFVSEKYPGLAKQAQNLLKT